MTPAPPAKSNPANPPARRRLTREGDFRPWLKADASLDGSALFWLPISGFPLTHDESRWAQTFLRHFAMALQQQFGLRAELFLRYKEVGPDLVVDFRTYMARQPRLFGLGLEGTELPAEPTEEERKEMTERLKTEEFPGSAGRTLLWFVNKQHEAQRGLFFGHGHMCTLFLPPDPKTKPPDLPLTPALRAAFPVFQQRDVDAEIAAEYAKKDAFLARSKQLFGSVIEGKAEYQAIDFIVPRMESKTFFAAPTELRKRWFALAPVYVEESLANKGLLLAIEDVRYEKAIRAALDVMAGDGLAYPELLR